MTDFDSFKDAKGLTWQQIASLLQVLDSKSFTKKFPSPGAISPTGAWPRACFLSFSLSANLFMVFRSTENFLQTRLPHREFRVNLLVERV